MFIGFATARAQKHNAKLRLFIAPQLMEDCSDDALVNLNLYPALERARTSGRALVEETRACMGCSERS